MNVRHLFRRLPPFIWVETDEGRKDYTLELMQDTFSTEYKIVYRGIHDGTLLAEQTIRLRPDITIEEAVQTAIVELVSYLDNSTLIHYEGKKIRQAS